MLVRNHIVIFSLLFVLLFIQEANAITFNVPAVRPKCVSGCGVTGGGRHTDDDDEPYTPPEKTYEEQQREKAEKLKNDALKESDLESAIQKLEEALRLDPNNPEIINALESVKDKLAEKKKEEEKAIEERDRAYGNSEINQLINSPIFKGSIPANSGLEFSDKGNAFKEAETTYFNGMDGKSANSDEVAKDLSGLIFDTKDKDRSTSEAAVSFAGQKESENIPEKLASNPKYKELKREQDELLKEEKELESRLDDIRQKKATADRTEKSKLEVEEAKIKQDISNVHSNVIQKTFEMRELAKLPDSVLNGLGNSTTTGK